MPPDASGDGPGEWPPAGPVLVPDDARELDHDRELWLLEQAGATSVPAAHDHPPYDHRPDDHPSGDHPSGDHRSARRWPGPYAGGDGTGDPRGLGGPALPPLLRRVFLTRRWQRYGLSGPLVALVLVLVAGVASLAVFLAPRLSPPPPARPLASPTTAAGSVGGLLPAAELRTASGGSVPSRSLRPAVIALVADDCGCATVLAEARRQAREFALPLWLVTPLRSRPAAELLARSAQTTPVAVLEDVTGALGTAFPPRGAAGGGVTLLLVRADGVLRTLVRPASTGLRLEAQLAGLAAAG